MKIHLCMLLLGSLYSAAAFSHTSDELLKLNSGLHKDGEDSNAPFTGSCSAKIDEKNKTILLKFINEDFNQAVTLVVTRRFDSAIVTQSADEQVMIAGDVKVIFSKEGALTRIAPNTDSPNGNMVSALGESVCTFY